MCLWQLTSLLSLSYSTCKMGGSEDSEGRGMRGACHRASAGDSRWLLCLLGLFFPSGRLCPRQPLPKSRLDIQETSLVVQWLRLFAPMQGAQVKELDLIHCN